MLIMSQKVVMKIDKLTERIIGCAYTVYNTLGAGFLESVYKNAMLIELNKAGLQAESEKPITVYYDDQIVGNFFADIVVNNEVIIELKAVEMISKAHEVQLVNYLNAVNKDIGLLINFGGTNGVKVKRKYKNYRTIRQD